MPGAAKDRAFPFLRRRTPDRKQEYSPISNLIELLQPIKHADGHYVGAATPAFGPRLFGGQAIAQGLLAACAMEDMDRQPHSLHASFLRPGQAEDEVHYHVTSLAEGRSFAMRRVDAFQGQTLLLTMTTSFHIDEPGFHHQSDTSHSLDVDAALESLEAWVEHNSEAAQAPIIDRLEKRPIAIVPLDPGSLFGAREREPRTASWMKLRNAPSTDPALQRAALAYASDMMFLRNALLPHAIRPGFSQVQAASLDHSIWFHETPDFSEWHLYATESPWAGNSRGLNRGHFYNRSGKMVASVSQESLMRPKGEALGRLHEMLADQGTT